MVSIDGKNGGYCFAKKLKYRHLYFTHSANHLTRKGIYLLVCKIGDESFSDKMVLQ
jgi:hypothetical protein